MEMGIKSIKVNKIELLRSYFISAVSQYMQEKIKTNICPGNESQFTNKYYSARMGNSQSAGGSSHTSELITAFHSTSFLVSVI